MFVIERITVFFLFLIERIVIFFLFVIERITLCFLFVIERITVCFLFVIERIICFHFVTELSSANILCVIENCLLFPDTMKRYRYCEYLGKYFCPCCHTNEMYYIPGRILRKWDFTKYVIINLCSVLMLFYNSLTGAYDKF